MRTKIFIATFFVVIAVIYIFYIKPKNDTMNASTSSFRIGEFKGELTNTAIAEEQDDFSSVIRKMVSNINSNEMTGSYDHDFCRIMIIHNQSKIKTGKIELLYGKNDQIKELANTIVENHKQEITDMQYFLGNDSNYMINGESLGLVNDLTISTETLIEKIENIQLSRDIDLDFVNLMMVYQEYAILMCEDEVSNGNRIEIKKLAQQILGKQILLMEQIKLFLSKENINYQ